MVLQRGEGRVALRRPGVALAHQCGAVMNSACRDTTTPWDHLISATMTPTTAVAVKLVVTSDDPEPDVVETPCENGGFFGSIHKHLPSLSKLKVNKRNEQRSPLFR